jgi:hypothetical protein
MEEKLPDRRVPAPISKLNNPFAFVLLVWRSANTAGPLGEPFTIEILIPTVLDATTTLLALRIMAW